MLALVLIAAPRAQAQTETVLYNFTGGSDGGNPQSRLTFDQAGNLYGTTYGGGQFGYGTVFELSPNGSGGWNESVLYSFTGGADGANPNYAHMIFDSAGNLYGTAANGGASGLGVVFELSLEGTSWTETVLYSFAGGATGAHPINGPIMDPAGNLYGTTSLSEPSGVDVQAVYELSPSSGGWAEQVIYNEKDYSYSGLAMDGAGNIFGNSWFTLFKLSPNGSGGWNPTVLHTFGKHHDGVVAYGTPALDSNADIFGTTWEGGGQGCGIVYAMYHPYIYSQDYDIPHVFWDISISGYAPWGGVTIDPSGNIYGTTTQGGAYHDGTVYEVSPWEGMYNWKVLWSFNYSDGYSPVASLILDSAGRLYGTTPRGGSSGAGVVFEVNPSPAGTATALTSSPNPSWDGQAVTFTAAVTSSAGTPPDGGTVSFMKGTTVLGTGTLSGGLAGFTISTLPLVKTSVKAVYNGNLYFTASKSSTVIQVVEKVPTTTTLSSSLNPSNYGRAVTMTATVTSASTGPPAGNVTFKSGSATLGVGALNASGVATLTTEKIPVGTSTLTSTYDGNPVTGKSVSAAIVQTVNRASVSMVLTSTPNPSAFGKSVKLTAELTSNGGVPSEQFVTFRCNGVTLGAAKINSDGVATFWTLPLPQGSDEVTAEYAGSVDYSSASASVTQVVN